ncbi:NAD(P)H-binding protein [Mucilaginibacter celer]|uniref:NAD-dependent epimerase/dehydratase family protein n=1 Tax=Mucilaginibacter celer TaxID=2305508 RepID=A0A494W4A7_9SPHI|nr:NAD(P)H-binding protein [Mucilaginibacter celer]AYL98162.1 NAD-dependent epimerase/dehydratase family protein [Mucilaginibacter celer]
MAKKAIVAGASGLIGSHLLQILLTQAYYDEVLILVRKELPIEHHKLKQLVVDFDQLTSYLEELKGDAVFCCLGSTKKKTPDLSVYYKIDHDYAVQLAQLALQNGVKQYHLVSSIGANINGGNFYTKTKGQTEADITAIGLPTLHIYRPSALTGDRNEKRPMEKVVAVIMSLINPLFVGRYKKYRSIEGATVAMAMYKQSIKNATGVFIHESDKIEQIS